MFMNYFLYCFTNTYPDSIVIEMQYVFNMFFRYNQDVNRFDWMNICKSNNIFIFVEKVCFYFLIRNFTKKTFHRLSTRYRGASYYLLFLEPIYYSVYGKL